MSNMELERVETGAEAPSTCGHKNFIVYCYSCQMALCNKCYFRDHKDHEASDTEEAASKEIGEWKQLCLQAVEERKRCQEMGDKIAGEENLEDEVMKKVEEEFRVLIDIIEETKSHAKETITKLESVQNYQPPKADTMQNTVDRLNEFIEEMQDFIRELQEELDTGNFLKVINKKRQFDVFVKQFGELQALCNNIKGFLSANARPRVNVQVEVDKFRGFLRDVISYEPDFIMSGTKNRLHYFDEEARQLFVHELSTQTTACVAYRAAEPLPSEFSSVHAQSKIFITGGERKEGEARWTYSKAVFYVNERTFELERKADMLFARCAHQLAHVCRKSEHSTKDLVYAVGSKYPNESARTCEVYDIAKNKWAQTADLNTARHYHSITVIDDRFLYVIGGRDSLNENPLDSIERLDAEAPVQKWDALKLTAKDNAWTARDTCGSFALNDSEILVFGGDFGWLSDCFCFNTKNLEITKIDCALKKPEEFFQSQPVRYNDKVFCVGCLDKDVHVFSLKANKWFLLEKWFLDW